MKTSLRFKHAAIGFFLATVASVVMAQSSDGQSSFTATATMRDISGVSCTNLSFGTIYRIPLTLFAATDSVTVSNTTDGAVATTSAVGATVTGGHPAVCTVIGLETATPARATGSLSSATVKLVNVANVAQSLDVELSIGTFDSGAAAGSTGKFRIGGSMTLKTAGPAAAEAADGVFTSAAVTITATN